MAGDQQIFVGSDGGATTSKVGAVWADGTIVSTRLLQRPTTSHLGPLSVVNGWVTAVGDYLAEHQLQWRDVGGVGLAVPGPFERYGVFGKSPNLPATFIGFDVHREYARALALAAGRPVPLTVANDGNTAGVAEAHRVRGASRSTVLLLAPGSGLGCAYVGSDGIALEGDTLSGMEAAHMPAPLHLLDVDGGEPFPCGCGRTWGCVEAYTTLSGLPRLLEERLARWPNHVLAQSSDDMRTRALSLRGLAQRGDALALEIFLFQAKALGLHVASLAMALDPAFVVIGGGLMDPEATTTQFRAMYLDAIRASAWPYLWPPQRDRMTVVPATLGDLSQSIGAALVALYKSRGTL